MKKIILFILISTFAVLSSCSEDKPTEPTNHAPNIQSISASPSSIKVNETTSLTCVATDADGDNLTYSWSSDNGTFPNGTSGSSVNWKAPNEIDSYMIKIIVSDGKETAESEKSIAVEKEASPTLAISPQSLELGDSETQLTFAITNSGTGSITYNITDDKDWLTVSPSSGGVTTETDEITATVDRSSLTPGDYSGKVTVSSDAGNIDVNVTMTVPSNPTLAVSPQNIEFGSDQSELTFEVSNSGTGSITYNITDDKDWLTVSPSSGGVTTETDEITATVDRSSLTPGDYSGKVTVSSDAGNIDVNVTMTVSANTGTLTGIVYQVNTNVVVSGVLVEAGGKSSTSAGDGTYSIDNVPAGEITAKATKTDYEVYEQTVTIIANQTIEHDIYMTGSVLMTTISGSVWDKDTQEAISGVKITIANQVDYTDASGHYQLPNVPQGTHDITAEKENYTLFEGQVFLSSSDKTFDIAMEYISTDLSGVVKDSYTGELLRDVKVSIAGKEDITDQNGYYEFIGLNKGSYNITAEGDTKWNHIYEEEITLDIRNITFNIDLESNICEGIPTVTYSGKTYNTVQIGDQCWLKENLDVGTMISSNSSGDNQTNNGTIEKYCYENNASNCNTYGGLYQWHEAMQYVSTEGTQGICPSGWHIPTYAEMRTLETNVGDKATKLINKNAKSGYTYTNETGFSALFAGYRHKTNGSFYELGNYTYFWSSTRDGDGAGLMYLKDYGSGVGFYSNYYKYNGVSVRCLKD